jgi:ketosteroid isomerase-like protein
MTHDELFSNYPDDIFDAATLALIESGSHGDVAGLDDIAVPDAEAWLNRTAWWAAIFTRVDGKEAR